MTTTAVRPATVSAPTPAKGVAPARLIKAELLKMWTTNSWWIFGICLLAATALALLFDCVQAHFEIQQAHTPPEIPQGSTPEQQAQIRADYEAQYNMPALLLRSSANIFTAGQYFGLLIVMLIGTLIVTNEFYHQTATTTFLTVPRRTSVIVSKLIAAMGIAVVAWFITTVINLGVGTAFFASEHQPNSLDVWSVQRAILMNLVAFALWAVLGVGLGVLIRNQLGATLTGAGVYLIGMQVAQLVFILLYQFVIKKDWVLQAMVIMPATASQVMISPERVALPIGENGPIYLPEWWVGALVLVGYGLLAGAIGTLITRKRDIS
jgi:ABC-2 type transport system permease protein